MQCLFVMISFSPCSFPVKDLCFEMCRSPANNSYFFSLSSSSCACSHLHRCPLRGHSSPVKSSHHQPVRKSSVSIPKVDRWQYSAMNSVINEGIINGRLYGPHLALEKKCIKLLTMVTLDPTLVLLLPRLKQSNSPVLNVCLWTGHLMPSSHYVTFKVVRLFTLHKWSSCVGSLSRFVVCTK